MSNSNIDLDVLQDQKKGKSQPWREKKIESRKLSLAYHDIAFEVSGLDNPVVSDIFKRGGLSERFIKRAYAVERCGNHLDFKLFEDGVLKLHNAEFCKVRLCPLCAWRRSLKIFGQVSNIMTALEQSTNYDYIFLTLTQRNVYGDALSCELDKLFKGFKYLNDKCKEFCSISKGWFRALEITHDTEPFITKKMYYKKRSYYDKRKLSIGDINPNFDTYHPHFHVIVAVEKHYFTSKSYLSTDKWVALWRRCLRLDYNPIVHVQKVSKKANLSDLKAYESGVLDTSNINSTSNTDIEITYAKAVAEVSKYSTKSNDYLTSDKRLTNSSVYVLDLALESRRLVGFGGIFKKLHSALNLSDSIDGDLVNVDNDIEIKSNLAYVIVHYNWHLGYNNYILGGASNE